ncbi:DNA translocase FtsK, partial [Methylobacterium sp. J-077]|uniref:DNA translocase FtsK n=1 Tax=Methylobacterium sp. J-077 TaxID=2836656 RepID=UPI002443CD50
FEPRADQATAPAAPHAAPAPQGRRPLPVVHDDEDFEGEDFEGEDFRGEDFRGEDEPTPVPAEAAASRVSAPVAPVAPARRPAPASGRDDYRHPALDLLAEPRGPSQASLVSADALEQNATLLEATLGDFGVRGDILAVRPGPVVTLYELEPAPGTKVSLLGVTLIFDADLHHLAIEGLAQSYVVLPPDGVPAFSDALMLALKALTRGFTLAVQ